MGGVWQVFVYPLKHTCEIRVVASSLGRPLVVAGRATNADDCGIFWVILSFCGVLAFGLLAISHLMLLIIAFRALTDVWSSNSGKPY